MLEYIGGAVRWMYGTVIRILGLTNRKDYRFREYIHEPDDPETLFSTELATRLLIDWWALFR